MTVVLIWGGLTLTGFFVYGCVAAIQKLLDLAFPSRRVPARRATPPRDSSCAPKAVSAQGSPALRGRTAQLRPVPPAA